MHRYYGANIKTVFSAFKNGKVSDPLAPSSMQFNGTGSYGNGGAMRVSPAALYALQFDMDKFEERNIEIDLLIFLCF
ncbi:unnamed protein product [Protopolystoma xenopodis]|uniref:Uncharacterized protein n=1 Tax=Protopolystoma xenopodis TaxID=117903 RepID=A0A448WM81_9PLAT|nr:unnamed protein product [Protopolystoma xenopodis]